VLVVAGDQREVRRLRASPAFQPSRIAAPNAAADLVPNHDCGAVGPGLVAGSIRGAIVHDDRLEAAIARDLVEDAPDLPRLVEGGDDDRDERLLTERYCHGCTILAACERRAVSGVRRPSCTSRLVRTLSYQEHEHQDGR